jgi:nucleotide-binding universal stress UspA family protein
MTMSGELVVGVGGDGSGFEAARRAARIASLMQVPLVLVFGFESVAMGPRGGALDEQVEAVGDDAVADIRQQLADAFPQLAIEVEMVRQRPVDALLNVADARQAELIAVGHGGTGPLRAALLGSVTYEIVHRSHIPVLVVPDEPTDLDD